VPKKLPEVDLGTLTKIAPSDLRLLWVNDWYDGPLEAVVEHDGKPCLMVLWSESDDETDHPYRWVLVELSAEQRADEERWHALFAEHVGDHWCFHGALVEHPPPRPDADPDAFFIPYRQRPPLDLTQNRVVGWTDEMPSR